MQILHFFCGAHPPSTRELPALWQRKCTQKKRGSPLLLYKIVYHQAFAKLFQPLIAVLFTLQSMYKHMRFTPICTCLFYAAFYVVLLFYGEFIGTPKSYTYAQYSLHYTMILLPPKSTFSQLYTIIYNADFNRVRIVLTLFPFSLNSNPSTHCKFTG